jgi:hypothetical protein
LKTADPSASADAIEALLRENLSPCPQRELAVVGLRSDGTHLYELPMHWDIGEVVTEAGLSKRFKTYPGYSAATAFALPEFRVGESS